MNDQLGTGNVFRLVGCEEQSSIRAIAGVARSPHWALLVTPADRLSGAAAVSKALRRRTVAEIGRTTEPWTISRA